MDFIIANLPIVICALIGIILLMVEVFMPGFGLPGIAGLLLMGASIVMTWLSHGAYAGLGATLVVLAIGGIVLSLSLRSATKGRMSRSALILKDKTATPTDEPAIERLVGVVGVAQTVLRPAGVAIIDGHRVNVVSRGEFIGQDEPVVIEEIEGARVIVRRVKEEL